MSGAWFALGMVAGACFGWPIVASIYYREGHRDGRQGTWTWASKSYLRRVAGLLDVATEGEDAGEVVAWALCEADKKQEATNGQE